MIIQLPIFKGSDIIEEKLFQGNAVGYCFVHVPLSRQENCTDMIPAVVDHKLFFSGGFQ